MTDTGKQRLFVGNLPVETTESDLQKLFKQFKVADVEIKRKKNLDDEVVFAYVNISKKRVDECTYFNDRCLWINMIVVSQIFSSFSRRLEYFVWL